MSTLGKNVLALLSAARRDALIVAPFIRSSAVERLLDAVPDGVNTTIFTRWRTLDIVAGASDLEVFDITCARGINLFLRHDLHAKLFAADQRCLVGSANVTASALGWRKQSNLELLVPIGRDSPEIRALESALFADKVLATVHDRNRMLRLVSRLRESLGEKPHQSLINNAASLIPDDWFPVVRNPEDLHAVYRGQVDNISLTALPYLRGELDALGLAPGMSEREFNNRIAQAISQTAIVKAVVRKIEEDGDVTEVELGELLKELQIPQLAKSVAESLIVLQRWLTYFMFEGYETTHESLKLIRAEPVDS